MSVNFQLEWMEKEEYGSRLKPDLSYTGIRLCDSSKKHQTALRMSQGME